MTAPHLIILSIACASFSAPVAAASLAAPQFSHASGVYAEPFQLTLTHPDPTATIYYTTDGSEPDPDNLAGNTFEYKNQYATQPTTTPRGRLLTAEYRSHRYQAEQTIAITDRSQQPDRIANFSTTFDDSPSYFPHLAIKKNQLFWLINQAIQINNKVNNSAKKRIYGRKDIGFMLPYLPDDYRYQVIKTNNYLNKGTAIRTIAVTDQEKSDEAHAVFFVGKQHDYTLPLLTITVPEKSLFDYKDGIFTAGYDYDASLLGKDNIKGTLGSHQPANWNRKGFNTPAYLTYLPDTKADAIAHPADIRTHGAYTRSYRNKSIRLYPHSDELANNRLLLRNSGQQYNKSFITDAAIQNALADLRVGRQRHQPVVTFINGEYNGILHLRDRLDQHYLREQYELPSKKVDLLKYSATDRLEAQRGSTSAWEQTIEQLKEQAADDFDVIEQHIDVDSIIDYYSAEIFIANMDWPGNNIRIWRYKVNDAKNDDDNTYADGRWRWLLFDLDQAGGGWNHRYDADKQTLDRVLEHNPKGGSLAVVFNYLLENDTFRQRFITRFSDLLNSTFLPEHMTGVIRETQQQIAPEMPRHIARWHAPKSMKYWQKSVNDLVSFFEKRPAYQWQHLQDSFQLDSPYTLEVSQQGQGQIHINSLVINQQQQQHQNQEQTPWQGQYFKHLPITLTADPAPGYRFSHWEGIDSTNANASAHKASLRLTPTNDMQLRAVMVKEN